MPNQCSIAAAALATPAATDEAAKQPAAPAPAEVNTSTAAELTPPTPESKGTVDVAQSGLPSTVDPVLQKTKHGIALGFQAAKSYGCVGEMSQNSGQGMSIDSHRWLSLHLNPLTQFSNRLALTHARLGSMQK
jgi:hypothetical protein